jgi:hypothetical protein
MNLKRIVAIILLPAALPLAFGAAGSPSASTPVVWVASLHGAVSFQPSGFQGDEGWVPAEVNHPLVAGDRIATVGAAGVELRSDSGTLTIPADTTVLLQRLDQDAVLVKLEQGGVDLKIDRYTPGRKLEVATPNLSLEPVAAGQYRFETDKDGNTKTVAVESGQCVASWDSGKTFTVGAGQEAQIAGANVALNPPNPLPSLNPPDQVPDNGGTANGGTDNGSTANGGGAVGQEDPGNNAPPAYGTTTTPYPGTNGGSDNTAQADPLGGYNPDADPGAAELNGNGDWAPGPSGGQVWYPRVAVGWAPYSDGHWQWIDPWGWTWIDRAPWGFAPFHYGRWAFAPRGWYWVPGPPVYSPALVAWVGSPGVSGVAWFPLGPGESVGYNSAAYRYVNRSHVMLVSTQTFVGAAPVAGARLPISAGFVNRASVANYAAVKPERVSVLGSARLAAHPPFAVMNRPVVTRVQPGPAAAPFARRQSLWAQSPGRPLNSGQIRSAAISPVGFRVTGASSFQARPGFSPYAGSYSQRPPVRPQPTPGYRYPAQPNRPAPQYARPQPPRPQPQPRPAPQTRPAAPRPAPPAAHPAAKSH